MSRPRDSFLLALTKKVGSTVPKVIGFPGYLISIPFSLASDFVNSAPRGFGVPRIISNVSDTAIFAVAALGTCDLALDIGRKVVCTSLNRRVECEICNGWDALQCTTCKGTGKVMYHVKNYTLRRGEKATAQSIANAIKNNRAELVHFPAVMDLNIPLPFKDCPTCDGSGVLGCSGCKQHVPIKISQEIMNDHPSSRARVIMESLRYPLERTIHGMRDPSIANFLLITMPQILGGFEYDDDAKKKLWWQYKESTRYDKLREAVAERKPGWEHLQTAMISIDPERARNDPVVVNNIPYHRAKYALEKEVMKLKPPRPPKNWKPPELNLPLDASSWSEADLKDPKKKKEMKILLDAQRGIAKKILDSQWEKEWRQKKVNDMLEKKVKPYIRNLGDRVLPQPIIKKPKKKRRWFWFF